MSTLSKASEAVATHIRRHGGFTPMKPGAATKLLATLDPIERSRVVEVSRLYDHQQELGHWGDVKDVTNAFELDAQGAKTFVEGLATDYLCDQLEQRSKPVPEPEVTRRD